jgi:hypothetical protein
MAEEVTLGGEGTLFVGEDKLFRLELLDPTGAPVNMSGWTMVFDVRAKDTSADPALLSKVPAVLGTFNAIRADNLQRALVVVTDDDMNLFAEKTYRYSWKRMDGGSETVLVYGDFTPQKATAP